MADHTGAPVPSTGYLGSGPVSASFRFLNGCVVLRTTVSQQPTLKLCPVPRTPTQSNGDFPSTPPSRPESMVAPALPPAPTTAVPAPPAVPELASFALTAPPALLPAVPPEPSTGDPADPPADVPAFGSVLSPQPRTALAMRMLQYFDVARFMRSLIGPRPGAVECPPGGFWVCLSWLSVTPGDASLKRARRLARQTFEYATKIVAHRRASDRRRARPTHRRPARRIHVRRGEQRVRASCPRNSSKV